MSEPTERPPEDSRLHRYAVLVAFCSLAVVISGAAVTSSRNQAGQIRFEGPHTVAGIALALPTVGLLIWLARVDKRPWLIRLASITFAVEVLEGGLGTLHLQGTAGAATGTLHAWLAALLVVLFAAIALFTSPAWNRDPELVQDYGWPSLRSLSAAAALFVAIQVAFGAGFRHSAVGVMPHLLGALVVALFIMIVGAFATNQFPKHPSLRPMAIRLMIITSIQVFLGMAAFLMRMMEMDAKPAFLAISAAHVGIGSLTFAASVLLAIEIRRDVQPRAKASAPSAPN
jgi:heme A synthase